MQTLCIHGNIPKLLEKECLKNSFTLFIFFCCQAALFLLWWTSMAILIAQPPCIAFRVHFLLNWFNRSFHKSSEHSQYCSPPLLCFLVLLVFQFYCLLLGPRASWNFATVQSMPTCVVLGWIGRPGRQRKDFQMAQGISVQRTPSSSSVCLERISFTVSVDLHLQLPGVVHCWDFSIAPVFTKIINFPREQNPVCSPTSRGYKAGAC